MSGGGFKIEVDDLLATAPQFGGDGQMLVDYLNQAAASLQALGPFWGDDKPGAAFDAVYQKVSGEILLMLTKVAEDLEGISQGIIAMAKRYGQTEADITESVHRGGTYAY